MERGVAVTEQTGPVHAEGVPGPEPQQAVSTRIPKVLLVGAGGELGRRLLDELLRETTADVVLADRGQGRLKAAVRAVGSTQELRLSRLELDLWDTDQVTRSLVGVRLAICAARPAHEIPTTLARECMRLGVPYIDLSDDRAFVSRVRTLAENPEVNPEQTPVATGWSAVPALSAALVHAACEDLDAIDSIEVCLAPGDTPHSRAQAATLAHAVGQQFKILRQGLWATVGGWSEPHEFHFPAPVGTRVGHLIDAPDHGLFPELFGAQRVEFRLALPSRLVSRALAGIARSVRRGWVTDATRWLGPLRATLGLAGSPRSSAGGLGVQIAGRYGRQPLTKRISIVAAEHPDRLELMPASILVRRLLADPPPTQRGLLPHDQWIRPAELRAECERRGLQLIIEEE